jgi:hypothetical protein
MSFIKNTTVHNIFSSNWAYSDTPNVLANMLDSEALSPISSDLSPITATDDFVGGKPENTRALAKLLNKEKKKTDQLLKKIQEADKQALKEYSKINDEGVARTKLNDMQNRCDNTNINTAFCTPKERARNRHKEEEQLEREICDDPILRKKLNFKHNKYGPKLTESLEECSSETAMNLAKWLDSDRSSEEKRQKQCNNLGLSSECNPKTDKNKIKRHYEIYEKNKQKLTELVKALNFSAKEKDEFDSYDINQKLAFAIKSQKKLLKNYNNLLKGLSKEEKNSLPKKDLNNLTPVYVKSIARKVKLIKAAEKKEKMIQKAQETARKVICKASGLKNDCTDQQIKSKEKKDKDQMNEWYGIKQNPALPAAPGAPGSNKYVSVFGNNTNQNSDNLTDEEVINNINSEIRKIDDLLSHHKN